MGRSLLERKGNGCQLKCAVFDDHSGWSELVPEGVLFRMLELRVRQACQAEKKRWIVHAWRGYARG
jgi:hypothetical protein